MCRASCHPRTPLGARSQWRHKGVCFAYTHLGEPIWWKPKGMHWKTFERLEEGENAAQLVAFRAMHAVTDRLEAWCAPHRV